jgi:Beta-propeller repeat
MKLRLRGHQGAVIRWAGVVLVAGSYSGLLLQRSARADLPGVRASTGGNSVHEHARGSSAADAPLRFEANVGQFDARVRYLARGKGYGLYLTEGGATLTLNPRQKDAAPVVVEMHLVGERAVEPTPLDLLPGPNNYFEGDDATLWRRGVPSYGHIRYENVLPGVSVVYYGREQRNLEYDLEIAPGADPNKLELMFDGTRAVKIAPDGSAILQLPNGQELRKLAPTAFQADTMGVRTAVSSRYVKRKGGLGLAVGSYDHTRTLVIDPVLTYSTYFGGSSTDEAFGVATDVTGNTYVVGYTASTLFPTVSPEQPKHGGGIDDVFVVKLDPSGNLVYSTFLGGNGADVGYAIAADPSGNAYVTGVTFSTNFPTVSPVQASPGGMQDVFVAKLDPVGSSLLYSTYLGGSKDDFPGGISVASGSAYVTGTTSSTNFPLAAPLQATLNGVADAFVSRLSAAGSSLVYSTYLGGSGFEFGHAIATDASGNAFVGGATASTNFPTAAPLQASFAGGSYDGFVSKLNATGSALMYSTYLGGMFTEEVLGVASNGSGEATVAGYTSSTNFPVVAAAQSSLASTGFTDAFITRFNPAGSALLFSTYLGGSDDDRATSVGVDSLNSAYVVGSTLSANFPIAKPIAGQAIYGGASDGFVTAVDPSGTVFNYSSYLGGAAEDHAAGVAVQANGTTHIVGSTFSSNFPVVSAPISVLVGAEDAFVTQLPGVALAVPAGGRWGLVLLSGLLLGVGLLLLPLKKRFA